MTDQAQWFDVGAADDFPDGDLWPVQADGAQLVVYRDSSDYFALRDRCSHGPARLSEGFVVDGCIECPLHQGLIDIRSGLPRSDPVTEPVATFPVRVVAGRVEIAVAPVTPADAAVGACAGACGGAAIHRHAD